MQGEFISPVSNQIQGSPRGLPRGVMREASKMLEFEYAAVLRDKIIKLRGADS